MPEELTGLICGTGLADALSSQISNAQDYDTETPFGKPSTPVTIGTVGKKRVAFLNRHGKGHQLPPGMVPFAANIYAMKKLGVKALISSGAVGSLNEKIAPGDLVLVDQFIDKTFKRTNTFFLDYGAVHCELADPVCERLRKAILNISLELDVKIHSSGCYVCMEGPQFSTRAESVMHKAWGGDLIGMTAMPEARLAREAQICYAMVALPSDYDSWRPHEDDKDKQTLLKEITSNLKTATENSLKLITAILNSDIKLVSNECPCRKSLSMAVWTKEDQISQAKRKKLQVLFE